MSMEQTQGREKDPQSKATWLYTTFTSTQHFLQEHWNQCSKQHSHVPNTSQAAKANKSRRRKSPKSQLACSVLSFSCLKCTMGINSSAKNKLLSWSVSQTNFNRVRVSFRLLAMQKQTLAFTANWRHESSY